MNRRSRREFERIQKAGGVSSLAHPIRLGKRDHAEEEELIAHIGGLGLDAIEAYHSDHDEADVAAIPLLCREVCPESYRRVRFPRGQQAQREARTGQRAYFAAGRTVALEPETVNGLFMASFRTMPIAATLPRAGE